jgi:hypothetical protein
VREVQYPGRVAVRKADRLGKAEHEPL